MVISRVIQERADEQEFRFSRPIVRIGQNFALGENETVREIQSGLADITIAGQVDNDVVVIVGSLRLASTAKIGGSVVVIGGTLTIDSGAAVGRDMIVIGGSLSTPRRVHAGRPAGGDRQHRRGEHACRRSCHGSRVDCCSAGRLVPDIAWMWMAVAIFFFVYLMVNALFANPVRVVADTVSARPLSSFLLGLLVLRACRPGDRHTRRDRRRHRGRAIRPLCAGHRGTHRQGWCHARHRPKRDSGR